MRTAAVFLMLVLSGLPSAAVAAFERPWAPEACGGCPGDSSSESSEAEQDSCSPVCHDCACSLGARTIAPSFVLLTAPELLPAGELDRRWGKRVDPPRAPALDGVFHPPKL